MILLCIHRKEPNYSTLDRATERHASWVSPGKWDPLHLFSYRADLISQWWIHLACTAGKQSKSYFFLKINHKTTKRASFSFLAALWTDKKHFLRIPPPQRLELGCSVWNPGGKAGLLFHPPRHGHLPACSHGHLWALYPPRGRSNSWKGCYLPWTSFRCCPIRASPKRGCGRAEVLRRS